MRTAVALGLVAVMVGCGALKPKKARHDMPIRTYKATLPKEPKTFTVDAQIGDSYSSLRERDEDYYNVILVERGTRERLYSFVKKDTDLGKRAFGILKDGKEHRVTVTVQPGREVQFGGVLITALER